MPVTSKTRALGGVVEDGSALRASGAEQANNSPIIRIRLARATPVIVFIVNACISSLYRVA
jgi:hypothetical protein